LDVFLVLRFLGRGGGLGRGQLLLLLVAIADSGLVDRMVDAASGSGQPRRGRDGEAQGGGELALLGHLVPPSVVGGGGAPATRRARLYREGRRASALSRRG